MTTKKQIKRPCFGGGETTVNITITDERKGVKLGAGIGAHHEIVEESTDHIESEDAETMTFDFGRIAKRMIQSLEWHNEGFGSTVRRVKFSTGNNLAAASHAAA